MKKRRAWIVLLAILFGLTAGPASANGTDDDDPSVASLTGENLLASEFPELIGTLLVEGTCNTMGQSTFNFTATGLATGPYPGTFTESGTIVLNPFPVFNADSFVSTFRIDSTVGTVTGTKILDEFADSSIGLCGSAAFPSGGANALSFDGTLSYTADIVTPAGTAVDRGTTFVHIGETQLRGDREAGGFAFAENYTSTSLESGPGMCDGGDDNDDGEGDDDCDDGEDDDG